MDATTDLEPTAAEQRLTTYATRSGWTARLIRRGPRRVIIEYTKDGKPYVRVDLDRTGRVVAVATPTHEHRHSDAYRLLGADNRLYPPFSHVRHALIPATDPASTGATPTEVDALVAQAVRRRFELDVRPAGDIVVTRIRDGVEAAQVIMKPINSAMPKQMTDRQAADVALLLAAHGEARIVLDEDGELRVHAGIVSIASGATERLVRAGWLTTTGRPGALVTVSSAARIALATRALARAGVTSSEEQREALTAAVRAGVTPLDPKARP